MAGRRGLMGLVVFGLLVGIWACGQEEEEKTEIATFVKTTELAKVAFLTQEGSYDKIPKLIKELHNWVKEKGYTPVGPPLGIFFDDPSKTPPEELRWEIEWGIAEDVKEAEPEETGGVGIKVVKPMEVAATYHKGPYEKVGETYKGLFGWIFKNGFEVAGPAREIWWSDLEKTPEAQLVTELQVPVRKRR